MAARSVGLEQALTEIGVLKNNVVSDWEGPWVTADHAYEVTKRGVPSGDKLFAGISEYDDYLFYVRKMPGYNPGDTLALIAPFLMAYGRGSPLLIEVAKDNANFIAGAMEGIALLQELHGLDIVSTSYEQYVHYTTALAGIPKERTHCTRFPIDEYFKEIVGKDIQLVGEWAPKIAQLPKLGISATTTEKDLSPEALAAVRELDHFYWELLPETSFARVLKEVKPIGGTRKLDAAKAILEKAGLSLQDASIVGDSITDLVMLKETRKAGGLALSFNGNDYAVTSANVMLGSDNCLATAVVVDIFNRKGIEKVRKVAGEWSYKTLKETCQEGALHKAVFDKFCEAFPKPEERFPVLKWVDGISKEELDAAIKTSKTYRKSVRGTAVAALG